MTALNKAPKCLLAAIALVGPGCASHDEDQVSIEALTYYREKGLVRAEVVVVDPETGQRTLRLKESDFRVVLGDERVRPRVATTVRGYRLEFDAPRKASTPSFAVEATVGGKNLTGEHLTPLWAARYAFSAIYFAMFALAALVVAKFSYLAARRYRMAAGAAGGVVPTATAPVGASAPPEIAVRLVPIKGHRSPEERVVRTTSILGNRDLNFQKPFVKIENEGLRDAHAEIILEGAEAYVRNLVGTGVNLDGRPVGTAPERLTDGGTLKLGLVSFRVVFEPPSSGGSA